MRAHGGRGVFVAAGPGLRRDELIHGAGPLDITPTVLALFGVPVGADMDGRPLPPPGSSRRGVAIDPELG